MTLGTIQDLEKRKKKYLDNPEKAKEILNHSGEEDCSHRLYLYVGKAMLRTSKNLKYEIYTRGAANVPTHMK